MSQTPPATPESGYTPGSDDVEQRMRAIMARWAEPIYRHIRRMVVTHADAQDATQETFIKAYRNIAQLRRPEALKSWLYRIATNEALRAIANRQGATAEIAESEQFTADEYFDYSNLEAVLLQKAIHTLPPKQQAVFLLRYYDELSYEEIAIATGITAKSAKVNYHFAKHKIIEYLNKHDR